MCLNDKCFDFSNYAGKKVAVFISGPGYLEYPWALETASRLKCTSAEVMVVDLSDFATPYAMRLRILGRHLPYRARRLFRSLFLTSESRMENVMRNACLTRGIDYSRDLIPFSREPQKGMVPLKNLKSSAWGHLNAFQICQSTFSSIRKKNLESSDLVDYNFVNHVKHAIQQTHIRLEHWIQQNFDAVFLANGRQPVQAEITLSFRNQGVEVVLYESGGGYIYPSFLKKRLDYFFTSPANSVELREKITCTNPIHENNSGLAKLVEENTRSRALIPFRLNYLTEIPSGFDKSQLSAVRNFAFFSTSEWEISILQNYESSSSHKRLYSSQISAVNALLELLGEGDRLFVRLHPSDPGNQANAEAKWDVFKNNEKVVLYSPHSRVNSYELAGEMDGNFVWSSFLGYELALRDIPVAIIGDAIYASCFGENAINEFQDLKRFVENPSPVPQAMLLHYSNYLAVGGFEILESETDEQRQVTLGGKRVDVARNFLRFFPARIKGSIS
jgi:hypothetical protein